MEFVEFLLGGWLKLVIKIRTARKEDEEFIHFNLNNDPGLRDYDSKEISGEDYPKYWVRGILADKKGSLALIAEKDRQKAGFLIAHLLEGVRESILNNIFVVKEFRNSGVGDRLIKTYESFIRKKKFKLSLCLINLDNKKAMRFHEKNGYTGGYDFRFYQKTL